MLRLKENRKGYKETTLLMLNGGCMVQSNNDVEITDEIRYALNIVAILERNRMIDKITDKFLKR